MSRQAIEHTLNSIWYHRSRWWVVLWPFSMIYKMSVSLRSRFYQKGWFKSFKVSKPVVVVGNITAGGVGKTPLVLYLVEKLMERGIKPSVVMRGYGRRGQLKLPHKVDAQDSAQDVGDEAWMLYARTSVPVYIDSDRVAAATLACQQGADLVICDDGLQHYRLERDLELLVIDGLRQLGNELLLPAGPLREPKQRQNTVNRVIFHRADCTDSNNCMMLRPDHLVSFENDIKLSLSQLTSQSVHGVAGIGNPQRFFNLLRAAGLKVIEHSFPDHHYFSGSDFNFEQDYPIVMTEKDAVKCHDLQLKNAWYLKVDTVLSADLELYLEQQMQKLLETKE